MKRKHKKRILAELIILCILFFAWFLIGDKTWIISLWNAFEKDLKYFYKEKPWILWLITTIIAISAIIIRIILKPKERKVEPIEITLPKPSPLPIFEVKNTKDLGEAANTIPFMENPAVGKFIEIKEKKTWSDVKKEVDFSKLRPIDLSSQHRVFFIIGKAGAGKSTYMLCSLDKSLQNKSWLFNRIVFLNPNPEAYSQWAEALSNYDPEKTILVIDALWRGSDTHEIFKSRCSHLFRLAFEGEKIGERTIGPFKVLITIRKDEYNSLLSQKEFAGIPHTVFCECQITSESLDFEKILRKYLDSYKVPYEIPPYKEKEVIKQLVLKSEGLPFYIRHLFIDLKESGRTFSEKILEECPIGMVNLIWQTIKRRYYIEDDTVIPFLMLLLLNTGKYFSSNFLNFVIEKLARKKIKKDVSYKIESLRKTFFQSSSRVVDIEGAQGFTLDSHWKMSLHRGLEQPNDIHSGLQDVVTFYKKISDEQFARLLEKITIDLRTYLQEGFKDKADAFRCVDLAKLSEDSLNDATEIYTKSYSLSKLPKEYINYVRDELYELWISNVWKYRADPRHNPQDVIKCYKNAFDRLGVRSHLKQLSAYAYYLQTHVLPKCRYGTPEFQQWKEKIGNLHDEVIKGQLEQGIKDPISYQTLALFYEDVGEDEKAEKAFQESLKITPLHIPTSQAYAIFLKGRGKREWARDRIKALEYYKKAEEQFKKSIEILEDKKKELVPKEIEKYEKRLLNAYALFLIDKTEWEREFDKRIKIDGEVDELFNELLRKYPDHGQSINAYSRFLMGYGKILPQYKDGKNLQKAEKLLKDFIEAERNKKEKELSYYIALHILAIYYYRLKPSFYRERPNLEEVIKLLKESSGSFNPNHNSIAYNELGRLYMIWANILKKRDSTAYNEKMNLAKEAYEKAMEIVPENQQSAIHLSKVYFNYAFYFKYMGQAEQSEKYIQKALEVTKKFAYIPFGYYYSLTALGDEILKDHDPDMGIRVFTEAKKLGECLQIKPWYAIYKLGEIYKEKQDIDQALEHYLQSAQLENTSEGWGTRRDSIKQLMEDYNIKKDEQPALYEKCIKARIYCSKKAYELNPNDYKNCGDYGEDLSKMGEFTEAISILEKGANLIVQDSKLAEDEKRKKLNWLYQEIGYCYRDRRDYQKAEEFFDKSADTEDSGIGYFKHTDRMFDLEKYEKAVISFHKFIEKFPSSEEEKKKDIFYDLPKILQKIAMSYEKLPKEDESILAWKDYADVYFYSKPQSDNRVYGIIGNKLKKRGKLLEAREYFIKSIRINPNIPENLRQLGDINQSLKRWQEGMVCYKLAISKESNLRWIEHNKSGYQLCEREHNNQQKLYDASHVEDLIDQGIIEELNSRIDEALEFYEKALVLLSKQELDDRTKALRYRFIADAFWALGRRDDALKLYEEKIKDIVVGQEKIVVEAIIWFISSKS